MSMAISGKLHNGNKICFQGKTECDWHKYGIKVLKSIRSKTHVNDVWSKMLPIGDRNSSQVSSPGPLILVPVAEELCPHEAVVWDEPIPLPSIGDGLVAKAMPNDSWRWQDSNQK